MMIEGSLKWVVLPQTTGDLVVAFYWRRVFSEKCATLAMRPDGEIYFSDSKHPEGLPKAAPNTKEKHLLQQMFACITITLIDMEAFEDATKNGILDAYDSRSLVETIKNPLEMFESFNAVRKKGLLPPGAIFESLKA